MTERATPIRNVVFDVGNVIVRWEPERIVELAFGKDLPDGITSQDLFGGDIFRALTRIADSGGLSTSSCELTDGIKFRSL